MGLEPIKNIIQIDSIDVTLRNRLWNNINEDLFAKLPDPPTGTSMRWEVYKEIWRNFFVEPIQDIPIHNRQYYHFITYLRTWYFNASWNKIYDLIEFLMPFNSISRGRFSKKCNESLTIDVSGYRIIDNVVAPIIYQIEIESIEDALQGSDKLRSVNKHLKTALEFLSDRQAPDYRNSIKESISAVEALCRIIVSDDKATFGKAIAIIEHQYSLHPTLKEAYSKIYGYTSDADGIRHAMLEDGLPIEFEDAKFMLVSCSAFINYLKVKLKP